MYNEVFISHSKDDPRLGFFHKVFSGVSTKADWMEYEDIMPPPFLSIKNKINQCDALFVILSEYLEERLHTANWVAFEIGLAANHMVIPPYPASIFPVPKGMDVYVFEPIDNPINFAVPYCTYYARYNPSDIGQIKALKRIVELAPNHNSGSVIKCPYPNCQLEFKLLSNDPQFNCPACKKEIELTHR